LSSPLLRFRDLKDRRIVTNHVTLGRWIKREGFPPGHKLGPNTRAWREADVEAWLASRSTGPIELKGIAKRLAEGAQ
jgi:predicted DNA-binding transcriptional regulator AlpA